MAIGERAALCGISQIANMQTPFSARRNSPFPSRVLLGDLNRQRASASNTTAHGLARSSTRLSICNSAPRPVFVEAPVDEAGEEYDLLRVDGLAKCWSEERQQMVAMVFCVWGPPYQDQGSWQPLECVSPLSIVEYMRRDATAYMHLERMIEEETAGWKADPPRPREADVAYSSWPGQPDYSQGSLPDRPEVPTRLFTDAELRVADSTIRKWERYSRSTAAVTVQQVLSQALSASSNPLVLNVNQLTLHVGQQTVEQGGVVVGDGSTVHATTVGNRGDVQGNQVVIFGSNNNYRPDLAPE